MFGEMPMGPGSRLTGGSGAKERGGGSWTGLMMVSASSSFWATSRRTGRLSCSMCLARCTVSFFHVGKDLPQNRQGSSWGRACVSAWHRSTFCHVGSAPPAFLMAAFVLTLGSRNLCSRTKCCRKLSRRLHVCRQSSTSQVHHSRWRWPSFSCRTQSAFLLKILGSRHRSHVHVNGCTSSCTCLVQSDGFWNFLAW